MKSFNSADDGVAQGPGKGVKVGMTSSASISCVDSGTGADVAVCVCDVFLQAAKKIIVKVRKSFFTTMEYAKTRMSNLLA